MAHAHKHSHSHNKRQLWYEWLVLFVALPLLAWWWSPMRMPLLIGVALYCLWMARRKGIRRRRRFIPPTFKFWLAIRMVLVSLGIFAFSYWYDPTRFMDLPRQDMAMWLLFCLLYPLLSALPQEFIFRRYYFQRYRPLFRRVNTLLVSSVLTFGLVHLVYENWLAVALSLGGGTLFAFTYAHSGRLSWVTTEHALYGLAVFSSGLGSYFYTA
ncbi:CPBP family intramembrane glutamic endopeptidase [Ferrimonas marina]|uniref:CAAX protease self-immunity n=1 Tax=Ferrimonas marina TaxID=299255 RepID=A0A1M5YBI4_9GAMM|nr:CPBP family intramembrane glutamic endopeptidase [Ferrimonas marina]SHI09440.1 CAAX protease self-immunity [Ferrimonas marina]